MRRSRRATRPGRGTGDATGPAAPSSRRSSAVDQGGPTARRGLARVRQSCTTPHDSTRHDTTRHDTTGPCSRHAAVPSLPRFPTSTAPLPAPRGEGLGRGVARGAGLSHHALPVPGEPWAFRPDSSHAPDLGLCLSPDPTHTEAEHRVGGDRPLSAAYSDTYGEDIDAINGISFGRLASIVYERL
jgi:hypothetical protein